MAVGCKMYQMETKCHNLLLIKSIIDIFLKTHNEIVLIIILIYDLFLRTDDQHYKKILK